MGKLAVTAAVVFLLLAASPAHLQKVDLPEQDAVATVETETIRSEQDQKPARAIFLPSEDVGSQPENLEFNLDDTESRPEISEVEMESGPDSHAVPLTTISFRPINRHFPRRPLLPFRHRHHLNCRHRRQFRPRDPRFQNNAISFGDDMVKSDDGVSFDAVLPGREKRVPARWVRFHRRHEGPRFVFRDEGVFQGPRHFHGKEEHEREEHEHHHPHHHEHHPYKDEREGEEEEQQGGFLKNFRKFLNQF